MSGQLTTQGLSELIAAGFGELAPQVALNSKLYDLAYSPSARLPGLVAELEKLAAKSDLSQKEKLRIGIVLEQVSFELFRGISTGAEIKSWRSPLAQFDLVCRGVDARWGLMRGCLPGSVGSFLVEAKAHKKRVPHAVFSRMCSLLSHNFKKTVDCGVFITLRGATGFPNRGATAAQQKLSECRLLQVVFYHSERKPILVLDLEDLRALAGGQNFVALLRARLLDIEDLSGWPVTPDLEEVPLPPHLQELLPTG